MLEHADNNSDRIKALVSLAETASELEKYQQAYEYYLEVEKLESEEDIGPNKVRIRSSIAQYFFYDCLKLL